MKKTALALIALCLTCSMAWSGVVIEMEVTESGGGEAAVDTIYAQGEMLRMDPHEEKGRGASSMIFRDDALWIVDHEKKKCQMIDKKGMEKVSAQMEEGMKEMEAQMANMPPEQREMMKKMMKGKMPPGMDRMAEEPAPRRIEVGATEQVGEFTCTLRTLYAGEAKVWEVCSTKENLPGATSEAMEAFQAMARFSEQLRESLKNMPFADMVDTPFHDVNEVGGFPVRVRQFDNGTLTSETTLRSAVSQDLDDTVFAVPKGYKVKKLEDQMKKKGR